jgi:pyruvate formate-lyase activating enzyme-like uncharacterized protein
MSGKHSVSKLTESATAANAEESRPPVETARAEPPNRRALQGSEPIGPKRRDSKATIEKLADQYLALEELIRLHEIVDSIYGHIDARGEVLKQQIYNAVSGHKHKSEEAIESGLKRMSLSTAYCRNLSDNVVELGKFTERIEDQRLRYAILHYCRNITENAFMLGNIAKRDIIDERLDKQNGRKSKLNQNSRTEERRQKIEAKMRDILRADPGAEWSVAWKRFYVGNIRKLASRNTVEKGARTAYQKYFIEPPR